jgi:hypothetical protein
VAIERNTKRLLAAAVGEDGGEHTPVEYHVLSWRELYDKSIIAADRHHSSAGQWVLRGDPHFYTVTVITRPYYALPQQLCLAFDCFTETVTKTSSEGSSFTTTGSPIDEVASDFVTFLSLFAREPLVPLGTRRIGDRPVANRPHYSPPAGPTRSPDPPPAGLNSAELISILKGFAEAPQPAFDAAIAAMKFYRAALSLVGFDTPGAYVSLVSAIECLAGHHYKGRGFSFEAVQKFDGARTLLDNLAKLPGATGLIDKVKDELIASEYFLFQKFKLLVTECLPEEFWNTPDDLYALNSIFSRMKREDLAWCLRQIYDARSGYLHAGIPFPRYIDFGLQAEHPVDVFQAALNIRGVDRYLPPFSWFERLTHLVLIEYLRRSFAPELVATQKAKSAEKERLLGVIGALPESARKDLLKLVKWTARFLGWSVINPVAPNREWTDRTESVATLLKAGLIGCKGEGLEGTSWLKNRDVGEIVGEFFFGSDNNPFSGNELLLPKNWEDDYPE